ncbi:unnamed protein product [Amoebophrya sp. A25]|nr:unnamed protein product [Amoebophrya sp. A25]|eukprot:GSA25T00002121001.1
MPPTVVCSFRWWRLVKQAPLALLVYLLVLLPHAHAIAEASLPKSWSGADPARPGLRLTVLRNPSPAEPQEDEKSDSTQKNTARRTTVKAVGNDESAREGVSSSSGSKDRSLAVGGATSAAAQRVWALRNGMQLPNPFCRFYHNDRYQCMNTAGCRYGCPGTSCAADQVPTCLNATIGWRVSEVEFFSDEGCTSLIVPKKFVSEPRVRDSSCSRRATESAYGPSNAFDGMTNTIWVAPCCGNCGMWQASLGADFGTPEVVQCVKIWQVDQYFSPVIALAKEGTAVGQDNSLWRNVVTWSDFTASGPEVRLSGIQTALKNAIKFDVRPKLHCRSFIFGPKFTDLKLARNYCISDNLCGAVYEYACQDLSYNVTIGNSLDLAVLYDHLSVTPTAYTTIDDPIGTMHVLVTRKTSLNGDTLILGSRVMQPKNVSGHLNPPSTYPFSVEFSIKPMHGELHLCALDYVATPSEEGSCVHHKTGSLLEFRPYGNLAAPLSKVTQNIYCIAQTDGGCSAAFCAEACLAMDNTCNAFQYVARENGNHQRLCQLLMMPPYPLFAPPKGLQPMDGTLDVTDFYYRIIKQNETATLEKTYVTLNSATVRRAGSSLPLVGYSATLFQTLVIALCGLLVSRFIAG